VSQPNPLHRQPLLLKYLAPNDVASHLARDPRLIVPVGTTEQHGPHLPLGCDTLIVERLADDLSAEFRVLRAPTIEYGVNAPTAFPFPGTASVRRKTLHRLLNDLIGSWEDGGVEQFIILTAHGHEPHQEALSTLRTRYASVRTVDIFALPIATRQGNRLPIHGGEVDTSMLLYIDAKLVNLSRAKDHLPSEKELKRYRRGSLRSLPPAAGGLVGQPSLATAAKGEELYALIYGRIASRVLSTVGLHPEREA
jgi:creatinine amidohydrolase